MTAHSDPITTMARDAEKALAAPDLAALEASLGQALEAARHFRVAVDIAGRADVSRMIAFESLFRATVALQPQLGGPEIDAMLEARTAGEAVDDRAGHLRAQAYVVSQSILETLNAGYRVGFGVEVKR